MYCEFRDIEKRREDYLLEQAKRLKYQRDEFLINYKEKINLYYKKEIQIEHTFIKKEDLTLEIENTNNFENISEHLEDTNIPFSIELKKFIKPTIKSNSTDDRIINKRISQISNDTDQIRNIIDSLQGLFKNNYDTISSKIIFQGKKQVSIHNDSYKGYSLFLHLLGDNLLFEYFRSKVITEKIYENKHFTSVYLIYFGLLKLNKSFDEAWFFLASILNVVPSEGSLYVLEAFLMVLGERMFSFYGSDFEKIGVFLKEEYFKNVNNDPVKTRIFDIMRKIVDNKK